MMINIRKPRIEAVQKNTLHISKAIFVLLPIPVKAYIHVLTLHDHSPSYPILNFTIDSHRVICMYHPVFGSSFASFFSCLREVSLSHKTRQSHVIINIMLHYVSF